MKPPVNITENYIFYGDMMFLRNGNFVRKLGKRGQGPGEYILALGIAVDEEREELYVYDNQYRNIFIYDFENNFRKQLPVNRYGKNIIRLGNGKIMLIRDMLFLDPKEDAFFEYQIIDLENETVLYSRTHDTRYSNRNSTWSSFWKHDNTLFYYEGMTDTIFNLQSNGEIESPRYIVDKGKYKETSDDNYFRLSNFVESSSYLFFNINSKGSPLRYGAYNKKTGETRINEFSKFFNNDIDGGFLWLFNLTKNGEEGFYSILPYLAKERISSLSSQNKDYNKEKNRKLRELIDKLEEDDNTIYYFFHLK